MKDYLSSFDPHLKGLTGDPEAVAKVLSAYRVYAKKVPLKDGDYTMDHTRADLPDGSRRPFRLAIQLETDAGRGGDGFEAFIFEPYYPAEIPQSALASRPGWSI